MIGADAGEVMAAVQTAMLADLPHPRLRDAILAHPTMAEGLGSLFSNVPPTSVTIARAKSGKCYRGKARRMCATLGSE